MNTCLFALYLFIYLILYQYLSACPMNILKNGGKSFDVEMSVPLTSVFTSSGSMGLDKDVTDINSESNDVCETNTTAETGTIQKTNCYPVDMISELNKVISSDEANRVHNTLDKVLYGYYICLHICLEEYCYFGICLLYGYYICLHICLEEYCSVC